MNDPCILIVERDLLVRTPLAEYLRECGYLVLEGVCRWTFWWGLIDSWCKSFPTAASCERGADRRRRGRTWHA